MTTTASIVPVYVAGNNTIHAGRKIGTYASGAVRYRKLCGTTRTTRHDPAPVGPDAPITCKRCLAALEGRMQQAQRKLARLSNAKEFGSRHVSPDRLNTLQADYDQAAEAYHAARREAQS